MADALPDRLLLDERSQANQKAKIELVRRSIAVWTSIPIVVQWMVCAANVHRQILVRRVIIVETQPDLLEIVTATHPPGRFSRSLDRGKQNANQHSDDRDYDQ